MNFETIYLTRDEERRFLKIACGDTTASNTPEEDALFRAGLVKEAMIVSVSLDTNTPTVDMRAVVLSDLGQEYYARRMNQQKRDKQDSMKFWITTALTAAGIIVAALELLG